MCFVTHGMYAAGINPPIVEIEESANRECVVDGFIAITNRVQRSHIRGSDCYRLKVHLAYKTEESLLGIREPRRLWIL